MIFNPQSFIKAEGSFAFSGKTSANAHPCLNKNIIKEFWKNFTFQCSELTVSESDKYIFSVGSADILPLDGYSYSINVTAGGICLYAESEKDLLHGFMTLLDRFKAAEEGNVEIECCQIKDSAVIKTRMVHFCVFPETELWELQRFVRFCGALKYTHIILEFWGTLKYDCLKELSWPCAYTKNEIRPIIDEARDLGLQVIPMFNQWGHASACRAIHGKHVVLDQNPTLQTYFSEDGWCWDISKEKVRALLREIRNELIELCGEGDYFHIGCDEAYNFDFSKESMDFICDFINEVNREMNAGGRRILVWGDMFLYKHPHYNAENKYTCLSLSPETEEYMLDHLDKSVIIADWQYDAVNAPVETALVFKKKGFDCLLCPWDTGRAHTEAIVSTVKSECLMGLLHTTWHTLSKGLPNVLLAAVCSFEKRNAVGAHTNFRTPSAALMRKVAPINGDYRRAGWSKFQISSKW